MLARLGLKLLASNNPPALASQSVGITGMSHHTWTLVSDLKMIKYAMDFDGVREKKRSREKCYQTISVIAKYFTSRVPLLLLLCVAYYLLTLYLNILLFRWH